jgi:hypothetical protein
MFLGQKVNIQEILKKTCFTKLLSQSLIVVIHLLRWQALAIIRVAVCAGAACTSCRASKANST